MLGQQLRLAHEAFSEMRADVFAGSGRSSCLRRANTCRRRTDDDSNDLTPQEAQVARLAAQDLTNRQIASKLFVSASTGSTTSARCTASSA